MLRHGLAKIVTAILSYIIADLDIFCYVSFTACHRCRQCGAGHRGTLSAFAQKSSTLKLSVDLF